MKRVLAVGDRWPVVWNSKAVLLEIPDTQIISTSTVGIDLRFGSTRYDLVVFSATLQSSVRRSITARAYGSWPRPKILQLVARGETLKCGPGVDACSMEPDATRLIALVKELLYGMPKTDCSCGTGLWQIE